VSPNAFLTPRAIAPACLKKFCVVFCGKKYRELHRWYRFDVLRDVTNGVFREYAVLGYSAGEAGQTL
jgi:hypothetical protein